MAVKMDEDQMSLLDELLGDMPDEPEATQNVDETPQVDEAQEVVETPEEDAEQTVEESQKLDEQIEGSDAPQDNAAILREQILQLTEQLQRDPLRQSVQETVDRADSKDDKDKKVDKKLEAFLTDDEVDRIIDEPQLLNIAFNRAISVMQQNMQGVIQAEVNRQVLASKAVSDFYTSNQDLAPYSKFVQYVMAEIEQNSPNKTYAEIFKETANESRKRLGLAVTNPVTQQSRQQVSNSPQKPAFAGSKRNTGRPTSKPEFFDPAAADMF